MGLLAVAEGMLRVGIALARRQRADHAGPPEAGEPVVLCYGGSFTHGFVVDAGQAYPAQLEARLNSAGRSPRVHVVNMARSALGGLAIIGNRIRRDIASLRPDVVIVEPNVVDFDLPEGKAFGLRGALARLSNLRLYRLGRLLFVAELTGDFVLELEGVPHESQRSDSFAGPDSLLQTALVCYSLGKEHLAEGLLRRSLERRPTPDALLHLSEIYFQRRDRKGLEAVERSVRALARDPSSGPGAAFVLGRVLSDLGRYEEAAAYMEEEAPARPRTYLALAQVYGTMGKEAEQEQALLKSLRMTGAWKAARGLAQLYEKQGRLEKAAEVLRAELDRQDRMGLRVELDAIYRKTGRADLAREIAPDWGTLRSLLEEIAGTIRSGGAAPGFIVLAPAERLASEAIRETAERTGAFFVDIRQAFEEQPEGGQKVLEQLGDFHLSPAGNRWVAGLLAPHVEGELRRREARLR